MSRKKCSFNKNARHETWWTIIMHQSCRSAKRTCWYESICTYEPNDAFYNLELMRREPSRQPMHGVDDVIDYNDMYHAQWMNNNNMHLNPVIPLINKSFFVIILISWLYWIKSVCIRWNHFGGWTIVALSFKRTIIKYLCFYLFVINF